MSLREPAPAELREQIVRLHAELKALHDLHVQPGLEDFKHREAVLSAAIRWVETQLAGEG